MDYYNAAARREVKAEQGTGKIEPNEEQVADSNIGAAELSSSHLPGERKPGHGASERNLRRAGACVSRLKFTETTAYYASTTAYYP